MTHQVLPAFITKEVNVELAGCGGNGAQMLTALARLDRAIKALGHAGLKVRAWDPDQISEANVGRQLFYPGEVGRNKAVALVNRINAGFGLAWEAESKRFASDIQRNQEGTLAISCVDSAPARVEIGRQLERANDYYTPAYWLDLGNRANDGQVILGQVGRDTRHQPLLPTVLDLYPELKTTTLPDDDAPSCSLAEALERQSLFINDGVVALAKQILWLMFRTGQLEWHGAFINLLSGHATPLPVDPKAWARFGVPLAPTKQQPKPKKGRR